MKYIWYSPQKSKYPLFIMDLLQNSPDKRGMITLCYIRPRGYKTFFVLNSVEHEILNAHKYKNIKKFGLFDAQLSLECYFSRSYMLNSRPDKWPSVGNLKTFFSRKRSNELLFKMVSNRHYPSLHSISALIRDRRCQIPSKNQR